jgi:hypothetical protein
MVLTRSQAKKAMTNLANGVLPQETIPRNPIIIRDLISTHPTEAMDYLVNVYGAKREYMQCGWQYDFLVKILRDFNVKRMLWVFNERLCIPSRPFKELATSRKEVLELFMTRFFNETMEELTKHVDKFIKKNLY